MLKKARSLKCKEIITDVTFIQLKNQMTKIRELKSLISFKQSKPDTH